MSTVFAPVVTKYIEVDQIGTGALAVAEQASKRFQGTFCGFSKNVRELRGGEMREHLGISPDCCALCLLDSLVSEHCSSQI